MKDWHYLIAALCVIACHGARPDGASEQVPSNTWVMDPHGRPVQLMRNEKNGIITGISGFSEHTRTYGLSEDRLNQLTVDSLAVKMFTQYAGILGIDPSNYKARQIFSAAGGWHVRFEQYVRGVPIEESGLFFDIGPRGDINGLTAKIYPGVELSLEARVSRDRAIEIAQSHLGGTIREGSESPRLVILAQEKKHGISYHLVWKITVEGGSDTRRYFVSADDGSVIRDEELRIRD